ncbi:MAG: EAL domain-containing protein [Hyphomicrobiales bacterium]
MTNALSRLPRCSTTKLAHLAMLLLGGRLCDLDPRIERRIRREQVAEINRMLPAALLTNLANGILITLVFWTSAEPALLVMWLGALVMVCGLAYREARLTRPVARPSRRILRALGFTFARALAWGGVVLVLFPTAMPEYQVMLGCVAAGLIAGGAFGLSTVPAAALTYIWTLSGFWSVGLLFAGGAGYQLTVVLLTVYTAFLSHYAIQYGKLFVALRRTTAETETQNEVIGLVLKEFEGQRSDWLWQIDRGGRFTNISERFSEEAQLPMTRLRELRLRDLLVDAHSAESRLVLDKVAAGEPIFDLTVQVRVAGKVRHWLLTGRADHDALGDVSGYRGVAEDVSEQTEALNRLNFLAHYDVLTRLANRVAFHEATEAALAGLGDRELALLFVDLDNFKIVNDTLGHGVGDALLAAVARRISLCAGEALVGRLGGDEFGVLVTEGQQPSEAAGLAATICEALQAPFDIEGHSLFVGACIGIAVAPQDGTTSASLIEHADLALYRAKSVGRNEFRFYTEGMTENAERRRNIEHELRHAIERDELSLAFQPIVDLSSGKVRSFEVLLRWTSSRYGRIGPDEFIPIAEETGLIVPIGAWVMKRAARIAARWPSDVAIAVNLSPVQFRDGDALVDAIFEALFENGLPTSRFEVEITESTLLEDNVDVDQTLRRIASLGIRIALDDFGKGYSSLSYLKRFPFYKIKIDKAFIDELAEDPRNVALVRTIIDLANSLGMTTTAEGVETPAQMVLLGDMNCATIQGYLFSAPVSEAAVFEVLERRIEAAVPEADVPAPEDKLRRVS